MLFLGSITERLSVIALDAEDYTRFLSEAAERGIVGGTTYDALLAACALKTGAETIYTWNARHYSQCGPEVTRRLSTP